MAIDPALDLTRRIHGLPLDDDALERLMRIPRDLPPKPGDPVHPTQLQRAMVLAARAMEGADGQA